MQIPTDAKVELIRRLVASGLQAIEATAFVSPKWVPQLADAPKVMQRLPQAPKTTFSVLAPNVKVRTSQPADIRPPLLQCNAVRCQPLWHKGWQPCATLPAPLPVTVVLPLALGTSWLACLLAQSTIFFAVLWM